MMHVLVATGDTEGFRIGENTRLIQKESEVLQHADMANK
jgi:hypothetical protein